MTTATTTGTKRIDGMIHNKTGEISPAHLIGHTKTGKAIYQWVRDWSPIAQMQDGTYRYSTGFRCDRDGNIVI